MSAAVTLFFLCAGLAEARQTLHGHVPEAITDLKLPAVGRAPTNATLRLAISLPLRNREELTNFLEEIYTPGNPNFGKSLTPAQFTEQFGPTEQDYQALIEFARNNGLTVTCTFSNRLILDVMATVADIERVFHVTMRLYDHPTEARQFFAPDSEPTLDCSVPVLFINGLDNYIIPHPVSPTPTAAGGEGHGGAQGGSGPNGTYYAQDIRNAYLPGFNSEAGGQSIALLEYSGYYSDIISDYMYDNGILPYDADAIVQNWELDGATGDPATNAPYTTSYYECEVDIEMAMAIASGLDSIIVYELPAITPSGYGGIIQGAPPDDALNLMAAQDLCNQISSSWEFAVKPSTDQIFQELAAQRQSFFQSSGDGGGRTGNNVYSPFDDAYVTLVGATTLTTSDSGTWSSEVVWNTASGGESGGGISPNYSIPSWQQAVNMSGNGGSTTQRNMPDVAIVGNNVFAVYGESPAVGVGPTEGGYQGTSVAAPLWASLMAVVNANAVAKHLPPVGFINPTIYKIGTGGDPAINYASCFHDITSGNNENSTSPKEFFAVSGYDLCTGWGSPNGSNLVNALVLNDFPYLHIPFRPIIFNFPNLLGYWCFDPLFLPNSCINGYTGTLEGNAYIGPPGSGFPLPNDPTNQALELNGSDSWLLSNLSGQVTDQGSMLVWVYLTAQPSTVGHYFTITAMSQFANDFDLQFETDNHLYFYTDTGSATVYPEALPLNQWHFLAATFVANTSRSIYLDGALVASSVPGNHSLSTNPFTIGESQVFPGRYFEGRISDAAVFNRALSASEIANLYASSVPPINVSRQPGKVILGWPSNFTSLSLQVNTNLATSNWTDWPVTPPIVDGQYTVTNFTSIPGSPGHMFFRLMP